MMTHNLFAVANLCILSRQLLISRHLLDSSIWLSFCYLLAFHDLSNHWFHVYHTFTPKS